MNQTRLVSLIEATLNTLIGFFVSFIAWPIVAFLTGVEYTTNQHIGIILAFTILSVLRGYALRRFFNNGLHLLAIRLTKKLYGEIK